MPYLSEDWEENTTDLYRVYHSSYQFTFLHDFRDGIEINDVIEKFKNESWWREEDYPGSPRFKFDKFLKNE